jgi:integrase
MPHKRGQNEGSIRRRADRRWEARLNLGYISGKRVRKSFFGRTREEAAQKLAEGSTNRDKGLPVPHGHDTVAIVLNTWLDHVRQTVAPRTFESYELHIRKHAIPAIGALKLAAIRPEHIRALLDLKLKGGLSPRTVTHTRTILNTAFRQAVNDRLLAWNPIAATKRPTAVRRRYPTLEAGPARAFLTAARDSRFECAFAVALSLGLRLGEVLGLRWADVDLATRTLRVEQTIQRLRAKIAADGKPGYRVGKPKTDRSRRALAIPEALIPVLRRHRVRQAETRLAAGTHWRDGGLVFCNRDGGPMDAKPLRAEFKARLEKAELPAMRLQDLRHSAASLLLAQGVSLRSIMELLGHSTITLTANTYGHISREMRADVADRMDAIFEKAP